jgi:hypothetical protein
MIKYKIIETNADQHSIVVRFYTDVITEEMLATDILDGIVRRCRTDYSFDLPVPAPTGSALQDFITARAPVAWLTTQEAVLNPNVDTSLSGITALIGLETQVVVPTTTTTTIFTLGEVQV